MRKVLTLLVLMFGLQVSSVVAAGLDQSVIKLSRMSAGTSPLPILVTVKTLSGVTEDGLKIIVGNGWNTSNLKTDITVSISGLPTGLSPLPGITSANGVLGQVISFPSSDLVSGTTYGFYITGGIGVNPVAGDGANYKWRIQTLSGAVIDEESELKVPIIANDQVTIAGRVGASATDFQLDLVASGSATLNQNQEKEYQITYGSYLNSATKPLKIVVEWTQGTIGGQGVPTLDIADYVPGSASTADSGAVPVIDTVNRRIEWLINSFPANTQDKTVSFKLKTNSSYVGSSQVNFSVKAWLYGANVVSINKTVVNTYQYYLPMVPTSVPSETSNSTTTNTTSSSAPLPITTLALRIEKIDMVRLTDNLATVLVDSNVEPERTKIYYGTSIGSLNKSLISINKTKSQEITIDNLLPGKNYYFKVEIIDSLGKVVGSDIYTFKMADSSDMAVVDKNALTLAVENNVILDTRDESPMAVVVTEQNCSFKFRVDKPEKIKQIQLFVRNSRVLGASTVYAVEPGQLQSDLIETGGGGYIGHVVSPEKEGVYEIVVRIAGFNGSVTEQNVGTMEVVAPLMIKTATGVGIEGAKVTLSKLNLANVYENIPPSSLGIKSPVYTDYQGKIKLTLPKGSYRAEISLAGFTDKTVDFSIGMGGDNKMPQVVMEKELGNWGRYVVFYGDSTRDLWQLIKDFGGQLSISVRFFKVMMILQVALGGIIWWCFYKDKDETEKSEPVLEKGAKKFVFSIMLAILVILLGLDLLFGLKFGMAAVIWIFLAIINLGLFISIVNI